MNRTKAIFVGAGLLAMLAIFLVFRAGGPPAAPVPDAPIPSGPVTLRGLLSHSHVLHGGDGTIYLDVDLRGAASRATKKRVPLNVALVIDRSGSMAGDKLAHARAAAKGFVQRLRVGDRVAVITYGSDVTVLVPSTTIGPRGHGMAPMLSAIDRIVDRGGTFLSGGLEAGRQQVRQHLTSAQVGRVILISDGQANEGITTSRGLSDLCRQTAQAGVSVTTIGVGLHFNEDVLTGMAEAGSGHYYFVNNSSNMESIFSKELKLLAATVAKRPRLTIALRPGVELLDVYGYEFERVGNRIEIKLPDVYSEQHRKVICKLRLPTDRDRRLAVAEVVLRYRDAETGQPLVSRGDASVVVTGDASVVAAGQRAEVIARVTQAQVAHTINGAMKDYGAGNVSAAQRQLRGAIDRTEGLNRKLRSPTLNQALRDLKSQLRLSERARPSSAAGRRLIKRSKAQAYDMYK